MVVECVEVRFRFEKMGADIWIGGGLFRGVTLSFIGDTGGELEAGRFCWVWSVLGGNSKEWHL